MSDTSDFEPGNNGQQSELLSEFERGLREVSVKSLKHAPTLERRDRLMYECGTAAALATMEAKHRNEFSANRKISSRWRTLAIAMSTLWLGMVGIETYRWQSAGSATSVDSTQSKLAEPASTSDIARPRLDVSNDFSHRDEQPLASSSVMYLRSNWEKLEISSGWGSAPIDASPNNANEPPLRATDYVRLLDRI